MDNTHNGLKTAFQQITSPRLIADLAHQLAPRLMLTETAISGTSPEHLLGQCLKLRNVSKPQYEALVCAIGEICDVTATTNTIGEIVDGLKELGLCRKMLTALDRDSRTAHNVATWTYLHAPGLWNRIAAAVRKFAVHAKRTDEYSTAPSTIPGGDSQRMRQFERDLSDYLANQLLHGKNAHVEYECHGDTDRYKVSVDDFPANVQQFDECGDFSIGRNRNALNLMIEYPTGGTMIRVRCPLKKDNRREIAELFATDILGTELVDDTKRKYNLSRHLTECVLPLPRNPRIVGVSRHSIRIQYCNAFGNLSYIEQSDADDTDLGASMMEYLATRKVAESECNVTMVCYSITLRRRDGSKHPLSCWVDLDGPHVQTTKDAAERAAAMEYMREVAI